MDESTYYYKYHYGQRPKHERVEVTLETEIPELPPKDQRKKNPDKKEFEKALTDLDNQIQRLKDKIVSIFHCINEHIEKFE